MVVLSVILFFLISIPTVMDELSFVMSNVNDTTQSFLSLTVSVQDAVTIVAALAFGPQPPLYTSRRSSKSTCLPMVSQSLITANIPAVDVGFPSSRIGFWSDITGLELFNESTTSFRVPHLVPFAPFSYTGLVTAYTICFSM